MSAQFGVAELTDGTITAAVCVPKDITSVHPLLYSGIEANLATEYLGNGWLQFVPGAEAGGSGAGGLCRDMLKHVSEDVPQHHQKTGVLSLLLQIDPLWMLKNSPHISFSTRFRIVNKDCESSSKCTYRIERIVRFSIVLHSSIHGPAVASNSPHSAVSSLIDAAGAMIGGGSISEVGIQHRASNAEYEYTDSTATTTDTGIDANRDSEPRRHVTLSRLVTDSRELTVYVRTVIRNAHATNAVNVTVLDVLMDHLRLDISSYTYEMTCPSTTETCSAAEQCVINQKGFIIRSIHTKYVPPVEQTYTRLSLWRYLFHSKLNVDQQVADEYIIRGMFVSDYIILPGCDLALTYSGTKRFISREGMPGDMSRGIEMHPVAVTVAEQHTTDHSLQNPFKYTLLSEAYLITLPIPDASMPFNVLTLSSTVAAFLFGSMMSALVKKSARNKELLPKESSEISTEKSETAVNSGDVQSNSAAARNN